MDSLDSYALWLRFFGWLLLLLHGLFGSQRHDAVHARVGDRLPELFTKMSRDHDEAAAQRGLPAEHFLRFVGVGVIEGHDGSGIDVGRRGCPRPNEVRLQLSVLAYNLGNLWRRLALPSRILRRSLTSLQQRLVKTGGRLVKHARYYWLLLAEGHLRRRLFGSMLRMIAAQPLPDG
jgi:Transposase DDE domain group 1